MKAGGTLLTFAGQPAIKAVEPVHVDELTADDAREVGFDRFEELRRVLEARGVSPRGEATLEAYSARAEPE